MTSCLLGPHESPGLSAAAFPATTHASPGGAGRHVVASVMPEAPPPTPASGASRLSTTQGVPFTCQMGPQPAGRGDVAAERASGESRDANVAWWRADPRIESPSW